VLNPDQVGIHQEESSFRPPLAPYPFRLNDNRPVSSRKIKKHLLAEPGTVRIIVVNRLPESYFPCFAEHEVSASILNSVSA
jgi:hypothetical protein